MKIIKAKNYTEMSQLASERIFDKIKNVANVTLGLATGGTPTRTYQYLIDDYEKNNTSYSHVTTFNLDEYIGLSPNDSNSYRYYMDKHLFNHIPIPKEQTHIPNGLAKDLQLECEAYEKKIDNHGIDLQILGLGSNGHIGFNEPGTNFDSNTHVVNLADSTREANARFFNSLEEVPTKAITMGIRSIMKSKEIILLVSGERKKEALTRLLDGEVDESFPASILKQHPNVTIIADKAVLGEKGVSLAYNYAN
ncbi:glucosamine-6-phosphate deaminase [Salirhabdus salicampi]|uniref:glucosamine-6-phosphate deaminase n=1 Tax=Salirhabdus salicampi TaxID=476102 RepID=UPI0020C20EE0|nr:glucosamine-6-phosphate deaminase [Salirhabdus salicampi]MCP8617813.1 glucosamine-6-phosphate deaminase [Salirhabdus salicampi]